MSKQNSMYKSVQSQKLYQFEPPPWTPAEGDIFMEGWYDAADAATITESSNKVSIWADKSSGSYDLDDQGNSSFQPTTNVATINGLNAIRFENLEFLYNSSYYLSRPTSFVAVVDTTNGAWDMIFECGSNDPEDELALVAGLDWAFGGFELYAPFYDLYAPGSGMAIVSGVMAFDDGFTNSEIYVNGTFGGSSTAIGGNDGLSGIMVGSYASGGLGHDIGSIAIGELIMYNVNPWSLAERQKMEGYMAHKWGLTAGLPPGHPYKDSPPATS